MYLLIIGAIVLIQTVQAKQIFISYSTQSDSVELFKYFHSMRNEFFVDIGAYDPIYASNTANLLGWNGINVEANTKRHRNFLVSRTNQINLNVAITNTTGGYATLVQYAQDSAASIDTEYLKLNANPSVIPKEEKVYQMTMADLCHLYFPKRPKLMSLDVEGHGIIVLKSNDWSEIKCQPQVLIVEHIEGEDLNKEQRKLLEKYQYSFQKASSLNEIYIHKSLLSDYKKREQEGLKLLANMQVQYWFPLYQEIFKTIIPTFNTDFQNFRHIDPRTSPIYIHFATERIISIQKIKEKSIFLVNTARPILLLHYNPLRSKIYIGSHDFKITEIKLKQPQASMYLIEIKYYGQKITLYVFDHRVNAPNPLNILQKIYEQTDKCNPKNHLTHQKVVNVDNYIGN